MLLILCLSWGGDRTAYSTWCQYGCFSTTALIQLLPSQPLPTPLWLIRKVSGISATVGWGRGWKYLQRSQEGISLGVALWCLALHTDTVWELSETWPTISSHVATVESNNNSYYTDKLPKINCSFTYRGKQTTSPTVLMGVHLPKNTNAKLVQT